MALTAGSAVAMLVGTLTARRRHLVEECQFCTSSHCDLVDVADIVTDPLVVIEHTESLVPRERLAIAYTRAVMTDSNHIPEPLARELHEPSPIPSWSS